MTSTEALLNNHLKSFFAGDIDAILADYAPGAVMFTTGGPLKGAAQIRPLFERLIAEFSKPGARFSLQLQSVEGDCAYIVWTAETADNIYEMATDTFVVRDGKIRTQSFTGKTRPRH
jgi:ketosteroid isomerase-like protein